MDAPSSAIAKVPLARAMSSPSARSSAELKARRRPTRSTDVRTSTQLPIGTGLR